METNIMLAYIYTIKFNNKMKLRNKALKMIDVPKIRIRIALLLDCTEQTIIRYIEHNNDNLTKASVLALIKRETGLTDQEILEEETETVKNRA